MSESVYWGESTSTVAHDTGYTADRAREERRIANPCDTLKRIWTRRNGAHISARQSAQSERSRYGFNYRSAQQKGEPKWPLSCDTQPKSCRNIFATACPIGKGNWNSHKVVERGASPIRSIRGVCEGRSSICGNGLSGIPYAIEYWAAPG